MAGIVLHKRIGTLIDRGDPDRTSDDMGKGGKQCAADGHTKSSARAPAASRRISEIRIGGLVVAGRDRPNDVRILVECRHEKPERFSTCLVEQRGEPGP